MWRLLTTNKLTKSVANRIRSQKPKVVSVAGYPVTGKTTFCEALVELLGRDMAVRLPNEASVYSRASRDRMGIDGASLESIDTRHFRNLVESLLMGDTIRYRDYDRKRRTRSGKLITEQIPHDGILVLDGPQVLPSAIGIPSDMVFIFRPADYAEWLEFAVRRDWHERYYPDAVSRRENIAKANTVAKLLQGAGDDATWVDAVVQTGKRGAELTYFVQEFADEESA